MSPIDEVHRTNGPRLTGGRCVCFLLAACLGGVATSGCARARANTVPVVPLAVPPPPVRVVDVSEPESPPIISLQEAAVPEALPRPRPAPVPARSDSRPAEVARPDPASDIAKPAEDGPRSLGSPTLHTTPTQQEGEVERRIRTLLGQATGHLNRVNVQALNADARTQFETARRFVSQAEEALHAKNFVFAGNLADKAAVLAAQLAGR